MSQREHWGSKIGFLMATAGSAIGLGSLWRFPYIAGQNGGGAFVMLYLIFTLAIGIPIFIAELILGRRSQKSAVFAFHDLSKGSEKWKLVGWFNIITSFLILSYYCVVSGWTVNYTLMSLCQFSKGKTTEQIREVFNVMYTSSDSNLLWLFIFTLMTLGVVYGGIRKGIEYWTKILTPALLVILLALFAFSTTLSGFKEAVSFILYPDFSKITPAAVLDALGMSFFTLSVGLGIILTYGSYLKRSDNIPQTAFIIGITSVLVSLIAALMIFPIIFTFNLPPEAGPGLVFQTLPVLFAKLPGSMVISTTFFLLFVFTTLTSSISLLEVLVANLMEVFHLNRSKAAIISSLGVFIMGIPSALSGSGLLFGTWKDMYGMDFFNTLNYLTGSWMMPLGGLFTALFAAYSLKKEVVLDEFLAGSQYKFWAPIWLFSIRFLAPIAILLVILDSGGIISISSLFGTIGGTST